MDGIPMTDPFDRAKAQIERAAERLGIRMRRIEALSESPQGTKSFVMALGDGKGALYCHANGPREGAVFLVQKGIGWHYRRTLGGSRSGLGLPVSDEYDIPGGRCSDFEGGRIEWSERDGIRVFEYPRCCVCGGSDLIRQEIREQHEEDLPMMLVDHRTYCESCYHEVMDRRWVAWREDHADV